MSERLNWKNVKENKYCKGVGIIILSYLCVLAFAELSRIRGIYQTLGEGIGSVLLMTGCAWLLQYFDKCKDTRKKIFSLIGGCFLAFTHVYGMYLHYENNLFTTAGEIFFQFALIAGVMIFTVPLFVYLLSGLEKASGWWNRRKELVQEQKPKGLFLKYWGIIFVCYLPLFLHWWPINFVFDAKYQLSEELTGHYKIHHPLAHTLLMGKCYRLGEALGNVNIGISFYTLIQMLILTAAFAYTMVYLYEKKVPKVVRVICLLFYAVFPMNPIFSITATKDVLFAAFLLFFFVLLAKLCYDQEKLTWQKAVGLIAAGVLMVLFRRNALYALLLALPFLIWARKGIKRKGILTVLLLVCVLSSVQINDAMIKAVNATNDDSIQESMSVPLQQIARVANYRKEELDEELYQEVLLYLNESVLASYNPYLSDGIKNNVNVNLLESNLVNFWKLWAKIGLKFPGEYLESVMTNTLGYWYLGDVEHSGASGDDVSLYHTLIGMGQEITKVDYFPIAGIFYDNMFWRMDYRDVPILGYSFRCCVYFWLLVIYALFTAYRKEYKKLLPVMIIFAYQASCFLGPWVILRYVYSIVVCCPVIIMMGLEKQNSIVE